MLIRSIRDHCKFKNEYVINVLYKETEEYKLAYDFLKTKKSVKGVIFHKENNFKDDFLAILGLKKYTCLLTDDSLFFRDSSFIILPEENETFSFRLGFNTLVQDHTVPTFQPPLLPDGIFRNIVYWNPSKYGNHCNFGYPYSIDGHIYQTINLSNILMAPEYRSTNDMEGILNNHRDRIHRIYSHTHSRLVNIPCNNISGLTRAGVFHSYSMQELNSLFMSDKILNIKEVPIVGCHQELEFEVVNGGV